MKMDQKTRASRDGRGQIMLLLADIGEDKKQELINRYMRENILDSEKMSGHRQAMLVGNWLNNGAKLITKGITDEELHQVVEHLTVLIHARKYNLDIRKSFINHNLTAICEKYFDPEGKYKKYNKTPEERRKMVEKRVEAREKLKGKIKELRESGKSVEEIATELCFPESTIRNLLKEIE